jgi:uncharacterized repeat protein (TIGR03803 family)
VIQASDGNFYGTTFEGGAGYGTFFKITSGGTLTTLHSFVGTDGDEPSAPLVQASDGYFYGTTNLGGAYGYGAVFQVSPGGAVTTLHSFDFTDGAYPTAALIQAMDGNLYGTTMGGGSGACSFGCGTVFKIPPSGTLTTLHSFDGTDGGNPVAPLVQTPLTDFPTGNGNLYGTTSAGGRRLRHRL